MATTRFQGIRESKLVQARRGSQPDLGTRYELSEYAFTEDRQGMEPITGKGVLEGLRILQFGQLKLVLLLQLSYNLLPRTTTSYTHTTFYTPFPLPI